MHCNYHTFHVTMHTVQTKVWNSNGSLVSPLLANFFMEWLEQRAIATASIKCRPKLEKRYVGDVLVFVRIGQVERIKEHLNKIDKSEFNKFTHKEQMDGSITFLDTLIYEAEIACLYGPRTSDKLCFARDVHPISPQLRASCSSLTLCLGTHLTLWKGPHMIGIRWRKRTPSRVVDSSFIHTIITGFWSSNKGGIVMGAASSWLGQ